jgi:hypothetical protein
VRTRCATGLSAADSTPQSPNGFQGLCGPFDAVGSQLGRKRRRVGSQIGVSGLPDSYFAVHQDERLLLLRDQHPPPRELAEQIAPQPRDLEILRALWRYRFLLTSQIAREWWPGKSLWAAQRRMHLMTAAGWVTRFRLRRWFGDLEDAWGSEIRIEVEAYFDLGEHTLGFHVLHGRGRQSGVEAAMPAAAVQRWRDGLTVYIKAYAHREDALKDLDISEDALEPIAP